MSNLPQGLPATRSDAAKLKRKITPVLASEQLSAAAHPLAYSSSDICWDLLRLAIC